MKVTITKQQILLSVSWGAEATACTKVKQNTVKIWWNGMMGGVATSSTMHRVFPGVSMKAAVWPTGAKDQRRLVIAFYCLPQVQSKIQPLIKQIHHSMTIQKGKKKKKVRDTIQHTQLFWEKESDTVC